MPDPHPESKPAIEREEPRALRCILVDDEPRFLRYLGNACAQIPDLEVCGQFESPSEALAFAEGNPFDIAFLDVEMPEINGLDLSGLLKERQIRLGADPAIVLVTAYSEHAVKAWDVADYYLLKPYMSSDIARAIARVRSRVQGAPDRGLPTTPLQEASRKRREGVCVQTFGRFSVEADGTRVAFTNPKSKELLALLVDARGSSLSIEQVISALWEDKPYDRRAKKVYHYTLRKLREVLAENGMAGVLVSSRGQVSVDPRAFECDLYRFLDGDEDARRAFNGDYLAEYSWGEPTAALLEKIVGFI